MNFSNVKGISIPQGTVSKLTIGGTDVWKRGRLPSGYTEVEYIQSSGTQRMKLNYTPYSTDEIEIDTIPLDVSQNACFWCARGSSTSENTFTCFNIAGSGFRLDVSTNSVGLVSGGNPVANTEYVINAKNGTLKVNNTIIGAGSITAFTAGGAIELLASYVGGQDNDLGNYMSEKLKAFSVKSSGGEYQVNLVPSIRTSDNAVGMYDLVSNTFFGNAGTGTFTAGNPV